MRAVQDFGLRMTDARRERVVRELGRWLAMTLPSSVRVNLGTSSCAGRVVDMCSTVPVMHVDPTQGLNLAATRSWYDYSVILLVASRAGGSAHGVSLN